MTVDDLDTSVVGAFQAEKIDDVAPDKIKKMIPCVGIFSRGYSLPEQGTWHFERKRAVLKAHPEVRQLNGQNPLTVVLLVAMFTYITYLALHFSKYSWFAVALGAYTVGAWISFNLAMIAHDGTHRLVAKRAWINKSVALFAFLPVFTGPFGTLWMYEHMWHHNVVVDKSLRYGLQSNPLLKKTILTFVFFGLINILFAFSASVLALVLLFTFVCGVLGLRSSKYPKSFPLQPFSRFPQSLNGWTCLNIIGCIAFNSFVFYYGGPKALGFLLLSAQFANGLHPLGMRQVQEHYFVKRGQPTYSVYPPFAPLTLNVGHHVEHHDFPTIPWNRLPMLRKMAPEYYGNEALYSYKSYTHCLFEFLFNKGIPLSMLFDVDIDTPFGPLSPESK